MSIAKPFVRLALVSTLALVASSVTALAFERFVDPETLPPRQRNFALYGPLGDYGPTGAPASPGCIWSRIQIPTAQGLRWMAMEDCDDNNGFF